jgi:hypothetical protein
VHAFEVVLDEDATQLAILVVDVIRPLDVDICSVTGEYIAEGHGDEFAEDKLLRSGYALRFYDEGEKKVFSYCRFPGVAALAPS